MPSKRRQLNVRLDKEASARFDRLMKTATKELGVTFTQAQLIALALKALEDRGKTPPRS
jgi:hypothetical protein